MGQLFLIPIVSFFVVVVVKNNFVDCNFEIT